MDIYCIKSSWYGWSFITLYQVDLVFANWKVSLDMYNTCTIQELKANYELNIITIFISLALVTSLPSLMYRLIQPFTCEALLSHGPEM